MKFSIRDVLWLTVLVAVLVAWHLERSKFRSAMIEAEAQAKERE